MHLEQLLKEPHLGKLKRILYERAVFMRSIEPVLSKLQHEQPEIFRRPPTSRVKQISSIYKKVTKDKPRMTVKDFFAKLQDFELDDIAGARVTIASKDLYHHAGALLKRKLTRLAELKVSRPYDPNSSDPYPGEHWRLTSRKDKNVRCEVQVRTLSHDLWAVFSHYESYKKVSETLVKKDLKDLSRLLDVADDYVKTIRMRKIEEAEAHHAEACYAKGIPKRSGLTYQQFEDIVFKDVDSKRTREFKSRPIEEVRLCDSYRGLSEHGVFTKRQLKSLVAKKNKIPIQKRMEELNVVGGSVDDFGILCQCHKADPSGVHGKHFSSTWKALTEVRIEAIKVVERAERGVAQYFVSFNLRKDKDYPGLWAELTKLGGVQVLEAGWRIRGIETPKEISARLKPYIGTRDRLLVVPSAEKEQEGFRLMRPRRRALVVSNLDLTPSNRAGASVLAH